MAGRDEHGASDCNHAFLPASLVAGILANPVSKNVGADRGRCALHRVRRAHREGSAAGVRSQPVQALGIRHRYIKPRRLQQNGKVERSHRIDHKEFWGRQRFADFAAAPVGFRAWETRHQPRALLLGASGGRRPKRL
jgi:hypothetical protein